MRKPRTLRPNQRARILVVDDEEHIRSGIRRSLTLLGYHAEEAASGEEALRMLEQGQFEVMLLDIRMPGMDGVEVMRLAREISPDLLILVLTGYASLESAIAAVKCHAVDYLLKPASVHTIAEAVSRALQRRAEAERRGRQRTPRSPSPPEEPEEEAVLCVGPVALNLQIRVAVVSGGDGDVLQAKLSPTETALLAQLMRYPQTVLSCRTLAQRALGYDLTEAEAREIIRPHICRLRRKIEPDPAHPRLIRTIVGRGYQFNGTS
ncbi:MAG TPA: response regulator transcription factor [Chloroflexi bacterium]|nr:response regulator transcription factor [Chloroflexota bacterium]